MSTSIDAVSSLVNKELKKGKKSDPTLLELLINLENALKVQARAKRHQNVDFAEALMTLQVSPDTKEGKKLIRMMNGLPIKDQATIGINDKYAVRLWLRASSQVGNVLSNKKVYRGFYENMAKAMHEGGSDVRVAITKAFVAHPTTAEQKEFKNMVYRRLIEAYTKYVLIKLNENPRDEKALQGLKALLYHSETNIGSHIRHILQDTVSNSIKMTNNDAKLLVQRNLDESATKATRKKIITSNIQQPRDHSESSVGVKASNTLTPKPKLKR